jgi:hypothetical protein
MDAGELITRWTVRLALACYAGVLALRLLPDYTPRRQAAGRWLWTVGCLLYLAHVASAFQFVHGWSHEAAYRETARRSAAMFGLAWGGGLYLNYLFTAVWVADVLCWWRGLAWYAARPRWPDRALHGFLAFMAFNGAVVFATGPVRWAGLAVCLALAALGCLRLMLRRRRRRRAAQSTGAPPSTAPPRGR